MSNTHKILVSKPKGKKPFGKPRSRWDDRIRIDLRAIGWEVVDWICVAELLSVCQGLCRMKSVIQSVSCEMHITFSITVNSVSAVA